MSNNCLRSKEEHDIGAAASERGADETADATGAQNRVSHTTDGSPGSVEALRLVVNDPSGLRSAKSIDRARLLRSWLCKSSPRVGGRNGRI